LLAYRCPTTIPIASEDAAAHQETQKATENEDETQKHTVADADTERQTARANCFHAMATEVREITVAMIRRAAVGKRAKVEAVESNS
jgi:hypothetical protein